MAFLHYSLKSLRRMITRNICSTPTCAALAFKQIVDGKTTTVELVETEENAKKPVLNVKDLHESCPLCRLGVKVKYSDVLILEQFMREDGTVLPKELTGLCSGQQLLVERCVMQAHWSGLFPDRTLQGFDLSEYRRFNRYWDSDIDMYTHNYKLEPGSWYYIKRYDVGKGNPKYSKVYSTKS